MPDLLTVVPDDQLTADQAQQNQDALDRLSASMDHASQLNDLSQQVAALPDPTPAPAPAPNSTPTADQGAAMSAEGQADQGGLPDAQTGEGQGNGDTSPSPAALTDSNQSSASTDGPGTQPGVDATPPGVDATPQAGPQSQASPDQSSQQPQPAPLPVNPEWRDQAAQRQQSTLDGPQTPAPDQSQGDQGAQADQGTPKAVQNAQSFIGSTGWGTGANTYCETFTEQMTGSGWQGASAIDAWQRQNAQGKGSTDFSNLQPGDALYFSPTATNPYGHTGIYAGNGQFVSATANGIQQYDVNGWLKATGQALLGFVPEPGAGGPSGLVGGAKAEGGNQPLPPAVHDDGNGNLVAAPSGSGWAGDESPTAFFSRVGQFLNGVPSAVGSIAGTAAGALGGPFGGGGRGPGNQNQQPQADRPNPFVNDLGTMLAPNTGMTVEPIAEVTGPEMAGGPQPVLSDSGTPLGQPPTLETVIRDSVGSVVPGARIPASPLDAIQNAASQAGVPVVPDLTGQQSLQDYAGKLAEAAQHENLVTPLGLYNPAFSPPNLNENEAAPGSVTQLTDDSGGVRQAAGDVLPSGRVVGPTPAPLDEAGASAGQVGTPGPVGPPPPTAYPSAVSSGAPGVVPASGGKFQQIQDMIDRQNNPQDVSGDSLGLWIQRQFADRYAAANRVGGNALAQVQQAADAGILSPAEAQLYRQGVDVESRIANFAGAPQAAAAKVDAIFRPIYDSLQGRTYVDSTGTSQPLTKAVDSYAKVLTDVDRLAQGPRMSSGTVNSVADATNTIAEIQQTVGPQNWALVQQANDARQTAMNQLRQDLVNGGLLSQQQANDLAREYPNYNPVRVAEYYQQQLGGNPGGAGGRSLDQGSNLLKTLTDTGSPMDTQPALQSAMQAVYMGEIAVRRNAIGNAIIDAANLDPEMAGQIRLVAADDPAKAAVIQRTQDAERLAVAQGRGNPNPVAATPANTITRFVNGQREVWQVPKVLADVADGLTQPQVNSVLRFAGMLNAPIRALSTTLSPTFILSRAVWNATWGFVRSGQNPVQQLRGMWDVATNSPLYQAFIDAGGGMGHTDVGATEPGLFRAMQTTGQSLERMVQRTGGVLIRDQGNVNVGATVANLLKGGPLRRTNEVINMGPRVAEFGRQLNRGATVEQAATAGRRVVTDFSRGGQFTIAASHPLLFLNDHVRGILDVGRALRDDPMARVRLGMLTSAAVGAWVWNRQFGNQIDDVPQYVRDSSLVFMLPDSQPGALHYVALPLRNLAIPAIAVNAFMNRLQQQGDQRSIGQIAGAMLGGTSPVPGSATSTNVLSAALPTPMRTALEEATNRDYFRNQAIVPQSQIDRNVPAALQYGPSTSLLARDIGQGLSQVPGVPEGLTSPERIDYALGAMTGSAGRLASQALSTAMGQPANNPPGAGGLLSGIVRTAGGQLQQNAYDQRDAGLAALKGQYRAIYNLYGQANKPLAAPPTTLTPDRQLAYEQARLAALQQGIGDKVQQVAAMPLGQRQTLLSSYETQANNAAQAAAAAAPAGAANARTLPAYVAGSASDVPQFSPATMQAFASAGLQPRQLATGPTTIKGGNGAKVLFTPEEQAQVDQLARPMIERQVAALVRDPAFRALPARGPRSQQTYLQQAETAAYDEAVGETVSKWANQTWQARMAAAATYSQDQAAQRVANAGGSAPGFGSPPALAVAGAR